MGELWLLYGYLMKNNFTVLSFTGNAENAKPAPAVAHMRCL